jgi:hypothetical protein
MHMDEFIGTTEQRMFQLENSLTGKLIRFQPSYDCTNDSIAYNSTSLVKLTNNDTITVYSPCLQRNFELGIEVIVENIASNGTAIQLIKREIIEQFPKKHSNYPYWQCISCKFPNTIGQVNAR